MALSHTTNQGSNLHILTDTGHNVLRVSDSGLVHLGGVSIREWVIEEGS